MQEDYILYNQVIVHSKDYISINIIFNNILLTFNEDKLIVNLDYNYTIGTSSDSLYKIKIYLNTNIKELCIDNDDEKEYFIANKDITLNLNKYFTLENNTQYNLILEFITKLRSIAVRYYTFSFGNAYTTKLKGKESDIKEKKTNNSYRSLDKIKITGDLTGITF